MHPILLGTDSLFGRSGAWRVHVAEASCFILCNTSRHHLIPFLLFMQAICHGNSPLHVLTFKQQAVLSFQDSSLRRFSVLRLSLEAVREDLDQRCEDQALGGGQGWLLRAVCSFKVVHVAGWWFGTCLIFPYIGNHHPN